MKSILLVLTGLSSGLIIGSATAAFITILDLIPRLVQITGTKKYAVIFQDSFALGATICSLLYFLNFSLKLNKLFSVIISFIMGIFTGMLSSGLTEVINVIPVFSKKFKMKHKLKYIVAALLIGKTSGSLWYWLRFLKR